MGLTHEGLQAAYAEQHARLDAENDEKNIDVFVAPFDIFEHQTGEVVSYTTWPEDVPSWLPKVEAIAFTGRHDDGGGRWLMIVPWVEVIAVCGENILRPLGTDPPRFEVVRWPTLAEFLRLRSHAILDHET